jgi:hypothetical protein
MQWRGDSQKQNHGVVACGVVAEISCVNPVPSHPVQWRGDSEKLVRRLYASPLHDVLGAPELKYKN